jgi:hypothetical protein
MGEVREGEAALRREIIIARFPHLPPTNVGMRRRAFPMLGEEDAPSLVITGPTRSVATR